MKAKVGAASALVGPLTLTVAVMRECSVGVLPNCLMGACSLPFEKLLEFGFVHVRFPWLEEQRGCSDDRTLHHMHKDVKRNCARDAN
jgi:hypothetical protein